MLAYFPKGNWVSMKDFGNIIAGNNTHEMIDIPMMANDTVNVFLRPGHMITYQPNGSNKFNTTADVISTATISLVANRDENGHAEGKLFKDGGESLTELSAHLYEYYEFHLSAGSLKKWILNEGATAQVGTGISELIITNATDLNTTDFACWVDTDGVSTNIDITYDPTKSTLSLAAAPGGTIDTFKLRDIYFGDTTQTPNLCNPASNFWMLKDPVDLTGAHTTVGLVNAQPGSLDDLALDLSVLSSGVVSVKWVRPELRAGGKAPFMVPEFLVDAGTNYSSTAVLSDFVKVNSDPTTKAISIDILAADKTTPVYTISGDMQLGDYLNTMRGVAHTRIANFKGLMGLAEQTTTDLFLQDGLYSLWTLDTANPVETRKAPGSNMYGVHPFLMGAATDGTWFGVFANNAAAQDWRIKNDATTGEVSISAMATGGAGDLRFMVGATPDAVTKLYHTVVGKPVVTPQWGLGWN